MSLSKNDLKAALQSAFEDVGSTKTAAEAADDLATAIDTYIKEAVAEVTIGPNTVVVNADGAVKNSEPIVLTGDPDAGTGGLS